MQEIWKDIPNYEGIYQVSNLGNVKSLSRLMNKGKVVFVSKEKIMNKYISKDGYYSVTLSKEKKSITIKNHQLVAIAFLGHKLCGHELVIDHINDNKLDNRVDNLQIVTARYNTLKTKENYSSQYKGVIWDKERDKWISRIKINGKTNFLGRFSSEHEAHLSYQKALEEITKGK